MDFIIEGISLQQSIEAYGRFAGDNSAITFAGSAQRVIVNNSTRLEVASANALGTANALAVRLNSGAQLAVGTSLAPVAFAVNSMIEISGSDQGTITSISTHPTTPNTLNGDIVLNYDAQAAPQAARINGFGKVAITGQIRDGGAGGDILFQNNVTLTGDNTYTGNTEVTSGTLLVENLSGSASGTGNVTVKSNATLGGNGSISGDVTIQSFGNLKPGASAGTLTLNHDLTVQDFGKLTFELGGTGLGDYDRIVGMNNLLMSGTIELTLINSFDPQNGDIFDLMDWNGIADFSGFNESTELILPTLSNGKSWDTSSLESTGTVSVVPEPGSLALLGLGLLPFLRRRRVTRA